MKDCIADVTTEENNKRCVYSNVWWNFKILSQISFIRLNPYIFSSQNTKIFSLSSRQRYIYLNKEVIIVCKIDESVYWGIVFHNSIIYQPFPWNISNSLFTSCCKSSPCLRYYQIFILVRFCPPKRLFSFSSSDRNLHLKVISTIMPVVFWSPIL